MFNDVLDVITLTRKDEVDEISQRMVAMLLDLMDGFCRTECVFNYNCIMAQRIAGG